MFNFSLSIVSVYLTLLKMNDDQIKLNLIIRVIEGHNISECSKYFTSGVFKKKITKCQAHAFIIAVLTINNYFPMFLKK